MYSARTLLERKSVFESECGKLQTEKEEKEDAIESAEEELQRLRCVEEEWLVKLEQTSSDFSSKKKRKRQPPPHEDEDDVCIRKKAVRRF